MGKLILEQLRVVPRGKLWIVPLCSTQRSERNAPEGTATWWFAPSSTHLLGQCHSTIVRESSTTKQCLCCLVLSLSIS